MKKILLFASAVAVLFSSCSTDSTQDAIGIEAKMGTITANAAYQQDGTRTYLDSEGNVVWSKGDALGVFAKGSSQVQFGLVKGEDTSSGTFAGNTNYLTEGEAVYAYYPYDRGADISGTNVTFEIAKKQTYLPSENKTFDAAMAPAFASVEKLEDKENIIFNFKGAASYLAFPIVGNGTLESLELSINGEQLSGSASIDISKKDDENTTDVDETPAIVLTGGAQNSIIVDCGGIVLDLVKPVYVTFVVPVDVKLYSGIRLTAKVSGTDVTATRIIDSDKAVTKRNVISTINADKQGNAWTFSPAGYYAINATPKYGLEAADVAALDFITYAFFTQPEAEIGSEYYPSATDYVTLANIMGIEMIGNVDHDTAALFGKDGAARTKAMIFAEEIDLAEFDVEAVYAALGIMETETALKPIIKVYKNALEWYKHNEYAIESLSFNAVEGYNAKKPAVINGLTVLGNGVTAGAGLKDLKFTNSTVIVDKGAAGFVAAQSNNNINNVVLGAGNVLNVADVDTSVAGNYVGGIFGKHNAGIALGVKVEELPTIVTPTGLTFSLRPSEEETPSMPMIYNTGKVFGRVYVGNSAEYALAISLDDYKVTSLDDMPAIFHVTANSGNVLDITAKNVDATINNVIAVNGDTETTSVASIVINGVSYWNGTTYANNNGKYFTAEELAYAMQNGGDVVLTHDVDMQNKEITTTYSSKSYSVNVSSSEKTPAKGETPAVYNHFTIKNVKVKANRSVSLFGWESTLANVTVANAVINANYSSKTIGGLAAAGTAENVVVDGLTINLGKFTDKLMNIGGVFGTANVKDINNVEVTSFVVNHNAVEGVTVAPAAGVVAGTLNVELGKEPVTLGITKLTGIQSQNVYKTFGKAQTKVELAAYESNKKYSYHYYPYGTINVTNAGFASNGVVNAVLNANEKSVNIATMDKLAAGIVFTWTGDEAKQVSTTEGTFKDYTVKTNKAIGNSAAASQFWGFTNVAPKTEAK